MASEDVYAVLPLVLGASGLTVKAYDGAVVLTWSRSLRDVEFRLADPAEVLDLVSRLTGAAGDAFADRLSDEGEVEGA